MIPPRARGIPTDRSRRGRDRRRLRDPGRPGSGQRSDPRGRGDLLGALLRVPTLTPAGTEGTANRAERVQGPNLDQRPETMDDVIYAIRNGGFSGAIMPQNIVVGADAQKVAAFVSKYAGPGRRRAAGALTTTNATAAPRARGAEPRSTSSRSAATRNRCATRWPGGARPSNSTSSWPRTSAAGS